MTGAVDIRAFAGPLAVLVLGAVLALPLGWPMLVVALVWAALWAGNKLLAETRPGPVLVPLVFGLSVLLIWEIAVRLFAIPMVILPAPSVVAVTFWAERWTLWADLQQTFLKGALAGYVIGVAAAWAVALLADANDFLRRGLLPVGNFLAALPIVGTAPILVAWYGFDWHSKAAVVVVMIFFPVLVNTVEGLKASEPMQRDLMRTYGADYWNTLWRLRIPAAMPFVFNGLKIASTLALIGAIVAEFFGSPIVGMGFRISTSVGQLALDMVWAEIVVAAVVGTAFYGVIAAAERGVTFWHPSARS